MTITDYPSTTLLSTLERNIQKNLFPAPLPGAQAHGLSSSYSPAPTDDGSGERRRLGPGAVCVRGHKWGEAGFRRAPSRAGRCTHASDRLSARRPADSGPGGRNPASSSASARPLRRPAVETLSEDDDDDDDDDCAYDVVIATDCLWLEGQHRHLIESMVSFLAWSSPPPPPTAAAATGSETPGADRSGPPSHDNNSTRPDSRVAEMDGGPEIWITAGFHTGRHVIGSFLESVHAYDASSSSSSSSSSSPYHAPDERARPRKGSLAVRAIYEQDMHGATRSFEAVRPGEGLEERKKWVVVIVLGREDGQGGKGEGGERTAEGGQVKGVQV